MVESTEGSEKSGIAESQFRLLSNFALGRKRLPVKLKVLSSTAFSSSTGPFLVSSFLKERCLKY
jgi:hypothetical protein